MVELKKGAWTPEEDQKLISYVKRYGIWTWRHMSKAAGLLRSGKSCRLRWVNYLSPELKRERLTREETETIIKLHKSVGNKWSQIAEHLPGRTDNEIKNFWYTHLRKCSKIANGANYSKVNRVKHEVINETEEYISFKYVAEELYPSSSSPISETTKSDELYSEFYIAESYSPSENSCPTIEGLEETEIISSSKSHRDIQENFFQDLFSPEDVYIPPHLYQSPGSRCLSNNEDLTSFWFDIFMEATCL